MIVPDALDDVPLLASCWTTAGNAGPTRGDETSPWPLVRRVEAAAEAGWTGFGLVHADLVVAREELGLDGLRDLLLSNGIDYLELEMLNDWFATGERRAASDRVRRDLLEAAGELGARHIKIGTDIDARWSEERLVSEFRELCEQAAGKGTRIALEPMPFAQVRDIDAGVRLVDAAGHDAGGLMIDAWHVARAGTPLERVSQLDARYIVAVEIDDAHAEFTGDLFLDTLDNRRLPGEGDLDLVGFVRAIAATGYSGPWGVEILSAGHRARTLGSQVRLAYLTARATFHEAARAAIESRLSASSRP